MALDSGKPLRKVKDFIRLPLLYDYWYVAGLAEEFGRTLQARTILERSIVFFRTTDDAIVALQNRCAHRSFPLADSKLVENDIQCGYHGIRYNAEGEIVDVPSQVQCPAGKLRKYPTVERGPLVWIWMGDADAADESEIPETEGLTRPDWAAFSGRSSIEGNYLLMLENLADLSHLPFIHANSFDATSGWAEVPVQTERVGDRVRYWRATEDWSMAKAMYPPGVDCSGKKISALLGGTFESPAMVRGWTRVDVLDAEEGEPACLETQIMHFLTPGTRNAAHYYWAVARNCDIENERYDRASTTVAQAVFEEDRIAINAMQKLLDEDTHDITDVTIASDQSSMLVRRAIVEMAERARPDETRAWNQPGAANQLNQANQANQAN